MTYEYVIIFYKVIKLCPVEYVANNVITTLYTKRETPGIATSELENYKGKWLFVYDRDIDKLKSQNIKWQKSYETQYFRITRLSLKFLNPKTREDTLKKAYLLQIN